MTASNAPILQMKDISVSYGLCRALSGVDFDLYPGEIHGLVGEHRAGKSTLIKVLGGVLQKDTGDILLHGKPFTPFSPKIAIRHKIGIMYQSVNLPPTVNATEYVFAGRELTHWYGTIDQPGMRKRVEAMFARLGVSIQPDVPLELLPEAKQLMVELVRVLSIEPEVIIFDEISGRLTPEEMEIVYRLLAELKQAGKSVVYISHNMDEIFEFADRVTILRNGRRVSTEQVRDLDKVKLMKLTYSFMRSREELESDNRELFLLKKYNENIIKNLPEGVIILDPEQKIYIMNYAAIRILELEHIHVSEQHVSNILNPELILEADEILAHIQKRDEYTWEELEYGCEKILKVHLFPFKDEDYKFLGTIMIMEDVSKELYFNEYLSRTEKIATVAELAAGVAHEINNPLGIIQNYVAILRDKSGASDDIEKFDKMENELHRIVEIIETLLSFSTPQKYPMARMNLASLLHETIVLLNHKFQEKHISLTWNDMNEAVWIIGEENRLKQVFMNLLINSTEAVMYDGHIAITVDVHREEGYVEVGMTDDGHGIPEETLKHIFDPFFTTKAGKKNSGLGLSICQHIIESHQGLITCTSAEQTTFSVRLPIIKT